VKPVVTRQTSWLESTGECGVQQNQAGEKLSKESLMSRCWYF